MIRPPAAICGVALLLAVVSPVSAAPPDGVFCTDKPKDTDLRIASAVNALQVRAPVTPPIAVLDTGVAQDVPELSGRLVSPFDALSGAEAQSDFFGHGSGVAGIAAGQTGGDGLVRGVSPTSPVMPIAVYNRLGETSNDALIAGIRWAVDHGAAVINISSSTSAKDLTAAESAALQRATTDAFARGVPVVASAGNEGSSQANVPAIFPHVVTVGATTALNFRAAFSNFAPWVDLVSPAAGMVAPVGPAVCASGYAVANSTSYAPPAVAGALAMVAAMRPELTTQQRVDLVRKSATDLDPAGWDQETGYGLLNVAKALDADAPAAEASPEVDDDPIYVRGANAKAHPTYLTKTKSKKVTATVSPSKDPSDVYSVRLRKGERFVASATVSSGDGLVFLALWKPTVGNYDVTNEVTKQQVVSSGGFSPTPELKMRVTKTGTYYVSVEAQDPIDEDDLSEVAPATEPYTLTLSRKKLPTVAAKKKTAKKKK